MPADGAPPVSEVLATLNAILREAEREADAPRLRALLARTRCAKNAYRPRAPGYSAHTAAAIGRLADMAEAKIAGSLLALRAAPGKCAAGTSAHRFLAADDVWEDVQL